MDTHDISRAGARKAAAEGDLRTWVAEFLASPGSDNAALAESLSASHPWWIGPVELPLDQLVVQVSPLGPAVS